MPCRSFSAYAAPAKAATVSSLTSTVSLFTEKFTLSDDRLFLDVSARCMFEMLPAIFKSDLPACQRTPRSTTESVVKCRFRLLIRFLKGKNGVNSRASRVCTVPSRLQSVKNVLRPLVMPHSITSASSTKAPCTRLCLRPLCLRLANARAYTESGERSGWTRLILSIDWRAALRIAARSGILCVAT